MRLRARTYKHRCGDGSIKRVYRNIDDAFPLFLPDLKANLVTSVEALVGQPLTLEAAYEKQVSAVVYALGELNESAMFSFRAVYAAYQSDPCTQGEFLSRKVDELTTEMQRLTALRLKLRAFIELAANHPDRTDQIWSTYAALIQELDPPGAPDVAERKVVLARRTAREWISQRVGG